MQKKLEELQPILMEKNKENDIMLEQLQISQKDV